MDQRGLEVNLADIPLGPIRYFDQIGSTNDEAAAWALQGAPDRALVIADAQTAGRGRGRRKWHTPPGSALAFSVIFRPEEHEGGQIIARFTGLGALAVSRALQKMWHLPAQIKWPNDVLINRRKVAGVLAETSWSGDQLSALILGIGINVAASAIPPKDWPGHQGKFFPATSVGAEIGEHVERISLLSVVLEQLLDWFPLVKTPGFIQAWEQNLAFRGEWVQVIGRAPIQALKGDSAPYEVQISGLREDGALSGRLRSGEQVSLRSGDIHLRPVDSSPK
jgi:BirA family biotin operon repressor/biotin-[acetyl-CoA-carboxylase] ligase